MAAAPSSTERHTMPKFLFPDTGLTVSDTFINTYKAAQGRFFVKVNDEGNSCIYNGDRPGHSKGFCTADACY
jgi:hypothetical protein